MQKTNNRRVYPNANHQPNHKAKFRQEEAKERQAAYDNFTIQQKLDLLDTRLGKGVGATKQRARLTLSLQARQEKKETITATLNKAKKDGLYEVLEHRTSEVLGDIASLPKKNNSNKKYMKGTK